MKNLEISFTSDIIFRYYGEHTGIQEHSHLLWKEFTGIQSLRIENYMPHMSCDRNSVSEVSQRSSSIQWVKTL